jgi:hypothetical protein
MRIVATTGKNRDTLEISSGLIMEGTHTLDAAREIYGPDKMRELKHLRFERVEIRGTHFYESLNIAK